jgi:hypothetical protein
MAVFSLKNFNEFFSDQSKLWASNCVVRECDEDPKGQFVAFVDQGSETFDVSVNFGIVKEISQISCDCKKGDGFCHHKLALLLFVDGNKKVEVPKIVKKKKLDVETIFDDLTFEDLKIWLLEVFTNEKSLKAEFELKFGTNLKVANTADGVKKALVDLSNSVLGSKKNLETIELKKVMNLWENFVLSACKPYFENPLIIQNFDILKFCLDAIEDQVSVYKSKSFSSYNNLIKKINLNVVLAFDRITEDEQFLNGIDLFFRNMINKYGGYDTKFVNILANIFEKSTKTQQSEILKKYAAFYSTYHTDKKSGDKILTLGLWKMAFEHGAIGQFLDILRPVTYSNDYNLDLIRALIKAEEFEKAKEYCELQIKYNVQIEYSLPYFNIQKEIYLLEGDRKNYLKVAENLLPFTQSIDDFFEIFNEMPIGEEKTYFRNKTLAKMRSKAKFSENYNAAKFCVTLLASEQQFKKVIGFLQDYQFISLFEPFIERMLQENKLSVLKNILDNFGSFPWSIKQEVLELEKSSFMPLYEALTKSFTEYDLQVYIEQFRNKKYYKADEGTFVHFLLKHT